MQMLEAWEEEENIQIDIRLPFWSNTVSVMEWV